MKTALQLSIPAHTDRAAVAEFYQENGYYIARGVVDPADLAGLRTDFDRIVAQMERSGEDSNARWNLETTTALDADRASVVVHTHQVQKYSAAWARFCFDERFLDVCETLVGPDIVLHHTKLFMKPAGRGAAFPPHQDHGYFPTEGDSMFAAVVFLTPSDESNGCLRVWPGSHKLGPIPDGMGGSKAVAARFPIEDSVPAICAPGDVLFFSYLTVHGSLANRGTQPRKSVLFQLHSGRDIMPAGGHPSSNLVLRGWHHRMTRSGANAS
jgi:ectoine hydroxylase-related dioxygenase (phytanoyl-CoA dioxygenase family)